EPRRQLLHPPLGLADVARLFGPGLEAVIARDVDDGNVAKAIDEVIATATRNHYAGIASGDGFEQSPRRRTHVRAFGSGDNRREGPVEIESHQQIRSRISLEDRLIPQRENVGRCPPTLALLVNRTCPDLRAYTAIAGIQHLRVGPSCVFVF